MYPCYAQVTRNVEGLGASKAKSLTGKYETEIFRGGGGGSGAWSKPKRFR